MERALNLRGFPQELQTQLRIVAFRQRRRMADVVAEAVEKYLKELDGKPPKR